LNKIGFLANLAAASLLGVVLAYWSWAWLAPAAAARAPVVTQTSPDSSSAAGLFGKAQPLSSASAVRLTGVIAASGGRRGHAVMRLDGKKTVAVVEGDEVEPGLRLAEIQVDQIVLERNGARETVAWPQKAGK
jgi:general secretion pathway protein C